MAGVFKVAGLSVMVCELADSGFICGGFGGYGGGMGGAGGEEQEEEGDFSFFYSFCE